MTLRRIILPGLACTLLLAAGCGPLRDPADGTLDTAKLRQVLQLAEQSGARVEADVVLRPGSAGIGTALHWDTGIEATFRFRWEGDANADP